jgi:hypothetical protein
MNFLGKVRAFKTSWTMSDLLSRNSILMQPLLVKGLRAIPTVKSFTYNCGNLAFNLASSADFFNASSKSSS